MPRNVLLLLNEVADELGDANLKFPGFNSSHEGYAVIKEEVDELWDAVKNNKAGNLLQQREEAIQVAAMAVKFVQMIDRRVGPG